MYNTLLQLNKRNLRPDAPPLTWEQVNENWQLIEDALNRIANQSTCSAYAMNGTRLEIPRESGQHPSVIAIDSSGRLSVVDVAYTAEKIIITTTAVFTGQIILKS